jgi:hypothetical protein
VKTRDQRQEQLRDFGELFESKPNYSKSEFDGVTYEPKFDATRLRGEMARVYEVIKDASKGVFEYQLL